MAHGGSPLLLILLGDKGQFAHMMGITEGMLDRIVEIRLPAIVDTPALPTTQDAGRIHAISPTFGMDSVDRRLRCARCVQPVQFGFNVCPRLVELYCFRGLDQIRFQSIVHWLDLTGYLGLRSRNR